METETEKKKQIKNEKSTMNYKAIQIETIKKTYNEIKDIKHSLKEIRTNNYILPLEKEIDLGNGVNYII